MGRPRKPPEPRRLWVTRYQTPDGKFAPKGTPGAEPVKTQTDTYYVQLPTADPKKPERVSLKATTLGEAWAELRDLLERRAKEAAGIADPSLAHHARPLAEHVADWITQLRAGGRTGEEQLALLEGRMAGLAALAGWERLGQITRDSAVKALARLQQERTANIAEGYAGRSNRTRNHYLRHLKQFCKWLVEEGRLPRSPVDGVEPVNAELDVRHNRRSPSDVEVAILMAYCEGEFVPEGEVVPVSPAVRCRMTGPQRALGYRVCMATGFRADELRSLRRESFDLERGTVTVTAAYSKNRRKAVQALPAWLVDELRGWFAAGGGVWSDFPENWPGRLLADDQAACGVEHETAEGFFDFHSLRHWYISWAANQPGISPKTLQTLARHSDPRLSLKVYAHAQEGEVRKLVGQMPRPGENRPARPPQDPAPKGSRREPGES